MLVVDDTNKYLRKYILHIEFQIHEEKTQVKAKRERHKFIFVPMISQVNFFISLFFI